MHNKITLYADHSAIECVVSPLSRTQLYSNRDDYPTEIEHKNSLSCCEASKAGSGVVLISEGSTEELGFRDYSKVQVVTNNTPVIPHNHSLADSSLSLTVTPQVIETPCRRSQPPGCA